MLQLEAVTKKCKNPSCGKELPLSEFYQRKNSENYYSYCKSCTSAMSNKDKKQRVVPANKNENKVADYLSKYGVPISLGKHSCDLLAFGCITIEVKTAMEYYVRSHNEESWRVGFTTNQLTRKIDIIAIVHENGDILFMDGMMDKWFREDGLRYQGKVFRMNADTESNLAPSDICEPMQLMNNKLQLRMQEIQQGNFSVMKDI